MCLLKIKKKKTKKKANQEVSLFMVKGFHHIFLLVNY